MSDLETCRRAVRPLSQECLHLQRIAPAARQPGLPPTPEASRRTAARFAAFEAVAAVAAFIYLPCRGRAFSASVAHSCAPNYVRIVPLPPLAALRSAHFNKASKHTGLRFVQTMRKLGNM